MRAFHIHGCSTGWLCHQDLVSTSCTFYFTSLHSAKLLCFVIIHSEPIINGIIKFLVKCLLIDIIVIISYILRQFLVGDITFFIICIAVSIFSNIVFSDIVCGFTVTGFTIAVIRELCKDSRNHINIIEFIIRVVIDCIISYNKVGNQFRIINRSFWCRNGKVSSAIVQHIFKITVCQISLGCGNIITVGIKYTLENTIPVCIRKNKVATVWSMNISCHHLVTLTVISGDKTVHCYHIRYIRIILVYQVLGQKLLSHLIRSRFVFANIIFSNVVSAIIVRGISHIRILIVLMRNRLRFGNVITVLFLMSRWFLFMILLRLFFFFLDFFFLRIFFFVLFGFFFLLFLLISCIGSGITGCSRCNYASCSQNGLCSILTTFFYIAFLVENFLCFHNSLV